MKDKQKTKSGNEKSQRAAPAMSRRAMLKGTMVTMPTILTLQSGAALARSSNLISPAPGGTRDSLGRALCMEADSVEIASDAEQIYDLGPSPYARVTAIEERDYKQKTENGNRRVDEDAMCRDGGEYFYRNYGGGRTKVQVKKGFLVTGTAMNSFASNISVTDL